MCCVCVWLKVCRGEGSVSCAQCQGGVSFGVARPVVKGWRKYIAEKRFCIHSMALNVRRKRLWKPASLCVKHFSLTVTIPPCTILALQ